MATRQSSRTQKLAASLSGAAYRFVIDAYTPQTIPMARLAEYMRHLADIFGEPSSVHFEGLEAGSTVLVSNVEREAIPKVRQRVIGVRRREGPSDGLRAYKAINRLLREDNGVALLKDDKAKSATIIHFPGREEAEETFPHVREQGSIDGVLARIGGRDETVHVTLDVESGQITGCYTNRQIGKQLGHRLFEPVRLFGRGRWNRDSEGRWTLIDFKVESFEPLTDVPLSTALSALRHVEVAWDRNALSELQAIRHGPPRKPNGRH